MKKIYSILALVLFASTSLIAGITQNQFERIEENLIAGLEKDNMGLTVSCSYFLGEMKSDNAVIPLMKVLKNSDFEEERIAAALALVKINSEKGVFAVKQRIRFDESERVQRLCNIFYTCCLQGKAEVIVEPFETVNLDLTYNGMRLADFL